MKQIAIILAFLSPLLAVLKCVGGFDIPLAVVLAPISIIFAFVLLVWTVAISAVLYDKFKSDTNECR